MSNDLVVKDNVLINASYNLEVTEQRLILLSIITARETGQGITSESRLKIHASDYAERFNVSKEASYDALKNAVNNLFERKFTFKEQLDNGKEIVVKSRWISQISYIPHLAILEIIFSPAVVPLVTRLERHFTSYQLKQVAQLTSKYAIRLYELLIAWRSLGKTPILEISDFRQKIGVQDTEYKTMSDFKKRVLEPAIEQINKETDITVKYDQHKTGRVVSGFEFKFKIKGEAASKKTTTQKKKVEELFCKISDKQVEIYSNKLSKQHELSDLAGNKDYAAFAIWIGNILRDKDSVRPETAKRIFTALHTLTDFNK
ncbi:MULTISPECIES: replication initiation protein RepM [Acinetobacter]|uniref:replication initiation protein RepM n=1 Tax=Acinetobacter TaxID=469 RepID=UPI000CBACF7F|nr:replication initiation protein RepM [Acinetobacter pittii]PMC96353.1 RepB family plasmid replication initiator protein [Acinetobacter ursingii]